MLPQGPPLKITPTKLGHEKGIMSVAYSPDSQVLASGTFDDSIVFRNGATGKVLTEYHANEFGFRSFGFRSVAFFPDGKTLISGDSNRKIRLWNVQTARKPKTFGEHEEGLITSVCVSFDGKYLASGGAGVHTRIRIWDVSTGKVLNKVGEHRGHDVVYSLAFSPDGTTLASGAGVSSGDEIHLWDVATGKELASIPDHDGPVTSVCFSSDGQLLASASWDKTVRIWDVSKRKELRRLLGHTEKVYVLAFSPDNTLLASGGNDKLIRLWNSRTGKELGKLQEHEGSVRSLAFSPDGRYLASGDYYGNLLIWTAKPSK
jgi:WD40 repeat protein